MFEYIVFFGMFFVGIIGFFIGMYKQKKNPVLISNNKQDDYSKFDSPLEQRLYQQLVMIGYRPDPQVRVGKYRIDLAFPNQMLAIECDGKHHLEPKQKEHDRKRDKYLREQGWTVLRFSGRQIYQNPRKVLLKIKEHLNQTDVSSSQLKPDILK